MRRLAQTQIASISNYGRFKLIAQRHKPLLVQSIEKGLDKTRKTKLNVINKVAWQHGKSHSVTHSAMIQHALLHSNTNRLHTVLKSVLDDNARNGNLGGVGSELLDKCVEFTLDNMCSKTASTQNTLAVFDTLWEIAVWTRYNTSQPLWELARMTAYDLAGKTKEYTNSLNTLTLQRDDLRLLIKVANSPKISRQMLVDLHRISGPVSSDNDPALFYLAALQHQAPPIPHTIRDDISNHKDKIMTTLLADSSTWRSALALLHYYIPTNDVKVVHEILDSLSKMTIQAQWPLTAISILIKSLLNNADPDSRDKACRIVQSIAKDSHIGFALLIRDTDEAQIPGFHEELISDELKIRLNTHLNAADLWIQNQDPSKIGGSTTARLQKMLFFVPKLRADLNNPKIHECLDEHYRQIGQLLEKTKAPLGLVTRIITEAGMWSFRFQSPLPLKNLITLLLEHKICFRTPKDTEELLIRFTRVLRNIGMMRYVNRIENTTTSHGNEDKKVKLTPLNLTTSIHSSTKYTEVFQNFRQTHYTILKEYLRRGVTPPNEVLAIFSNILRASNAKNSVKFSLRILPQILPRMIEKGNRGHLPAQAYYEQLIIDSSAERKRLLQLFVHLLGHKDVRSPWFMRRVVELTVAGYLHNRHFARGMDFFALEKLFIRYVAKPKFDRKYLNIVRPRFWNLHMFLRKHKYVPRLRLHRRMFRVHKYREYLMQATSIPSADKIKNQGIECDVVPATDEDIEMAIWIFLCSQPRNLLGTERYAINSELLVKGSS